MFSVTAHKHAFYTDALYRRRRRRLRRRRRRRRRRHERSKVQKETCLAKRIAKAMNSRVQGREIQGTNKVSNAWALHHDRDEFTTTTRCKNKTLRRCKMATEHNKHINDMSTSNTRRQTLKHGEQLQQLSTTTTLLKHTTEPQAHVSVDAAHRMVGQ